MDKELTFVYCNGDDVCKGTRLLPCLKLVSPVQQNLLINISLCQSYLLPVITNLQNLRISKIIRIRDVAQTLSLTIHVFPVFLHGVRIFNIFSREIPQGNSYGLKISSNEVASFLHLLNMLGNLWFSEFFRGMEIKYWRETG